MSLGLFYARMIPRYCSLMLLIYSFVITLILLIPCAFYPLINLNSPNSRKVFSVEIEENESTLLEPNQYYIGQHLSHLFGNKRISDVYPDKDSNDLPSLYIVTPTYRRLEQLPELTRMGQTLLHLEKLTWIVVEDAPEPSPEIVDHLKTSGLKYVYLRAEMPAKYQKVQNKPRGVANRNAGIEWVINNTDEGVIYFADDDNTYDLRIFDEIRSTKGVSMFPVGLVGRFRLSTPIVKNGKVIDFYDSWVNDRKFPVDMAGFAVNVRLLKKRNEARFPFVVGMEEDGFIKDLNIIKEDIEVKAFNCTKIWVWHTQTVKKEVEEKAEMKATWNNSNLNVILKQIPEVSTKYKKKTKKRILKRNVKKTNRKSH